MDALLGGGEANVTCALDAIVTLLVSEALATRAIEDTASPLAGGHDAICKLGPSAISAASTFGVRRVVSGRLWPWHFWLPDGERFRWDVLLGWCPRTTRNRLRPRRRPNVLGLRPQSCDNSNDQTRDREPKREEPPDSRLSARHR